MRLDKKYKWAGLITLICATFMACNKAEVPTDNPYAGGKAPLGIEFLHDAPYPSSGKPGDKIVFNVNGALKYKDKFQFFINGVQAEVISVSAQTIAVEVPENVSSGVASITLDGQGYIGPVFQVDGKLSLDASFGSSSEANFGVNDYLYTPDENMLLVGDFTDYNARAASRPVNHIAWVSPDGLYKTGLQAERGSNGSIVAIEQLDNGKYIIGGSFSEFNHRGDLFGITRLNSNGSLDTTVIDVINPEPDEPLKNVDTVATFNGGVSGFVVDLFARGDKIWVVGNFTSYYQYFYERSTYETKIVDRTEMRQIIRMDTTGTLDSAYNYNPTTGESYEATNGFIRDTYMQADNKIVIAGNFTKFNGVEVNHIARLKPDGSLDESFNTGTGADESISSITYNPVTQTIMITGNFKSFNGHPADGVAMLNSDGSFDESFQFANLEGFPTYAYQLSNKKVVVSGNFANYAGIIREGFMILNADGTLAEGYNNTGRFEGSISNIEETTTPFGEPALLIIGSIAVFDNQQVDNIIRVVLKD